MQGDDEFQQFHQFQPEKVPVIYVYNALSHAKNKKEKGKGLMSFLAI